MAPLHPLPTTREVEYDLGRTSCLYCHWNAFPQGISGTLRSCSVSLKLLEKCVCSVVKTKIQGSLEVLVAGLIKLEVLVAGLIKLEGYEKFIDFKALPSKTSRDVLLPLNKSRHL